MPGVFSMLREMVITDATNALLAVGYVNIPTAKRVYINRIQKHIRRELGIGLRITRYPNCTFLQRTFNDLR